MMDKQNTADDARVELLRDKLKCALGLQADDFVDAVRKDADKTLRLNGFGDEAEGHALALRQRINDALEQVYHWIDQQEP